MQKCLLDLDGVLANWVNGACTHLGVLNPYTDLPHSFEYLGKWDLMEHLEIHGEEREKFWQDINYEDFWASLELMPEAHEIVDTLSSYFGKRNVCILSSPGHMERCMAGKIRWLRRHFPHFAEDAQFLFGKGKHFCAHPDAVLIDDFDRNVDSFVAHGGKAFLVPRPWNHRYEEEPQLIQTLKSFLETL